MKTKIITVGGFLGAGKTTLLWEVAQKLMQQGKRVGLVTNDQAPELVDTNFLSRGDVPVQEVSGSCFCCNFQGLVDALMNLRKDAQADVILTEPVGSCTDLSATILQPMKQDMAQELQLSPLSVLVDPNRLRDLLSGGNAGLHESAAYILRKQLEEADAIVISKKDLLQPKEADDLIKGVQRAWPHARVFALSSATGDGLAEWMNYVENEQTAGQRIVEVDYDTYAEGEAVLGWLNGTVTLTGEVESWESWFHDFMKAFAGRLEREQASIGHVKALLRTGKNMIVGNLIGTRGSLTFRGEAEEAPVATLTLNARVEMSPEALDALVKEELQQASDNLRQEVLAWRCLSPGRPNPTHRYSHVV